MRSGQAISLFFKFNITGTIYKKLKEVLIDLHIIPCEKQEVLIGLPTTPCEQQVVVINQTYP
jgi:hypothetical protein